MSATPLPPARLAEIREHLAFVERKAEVRGLEERLMLDAALDLLAEVERHQEGIKFARDWHRRATELGDRCEVSEAENDRLLAENRDLRALVASQMPGDAGREPAVDYSRPPEVTTYPAGSPCPRCPYLLTYDGLCTECNGVFPEVPNAE
jgi:hypothetical protein